MRPATAADLTAIREIYNFAITERIATSDLESRSLADREEWFKQFGARFPLLVEEDASGNVVAYGGVAPYSTRAGYRWTGENFVYVAPGARGRGLGKKVLAEVIVAARRAGIHYLHARIFTQNEASLRLHREAGFRDVGVLRRASYLGSDPMVPDADQGQWIDVQLLELHPQAPAR